ncbi:LemA family protein [Boudabousia liubingyangii]|uniref:LemA family protein n=1 Tax=Boudabousia liubingyangii TaxID=1921764 RepID=A0A1Q5PLH6_9ACTO|nr:LemA family protein [Boudabousia liubingyangii]OKL47039.1 LemA family protein [Boudabousia liubingyangii]OKL47900.1 LemA family protein [Boudabousia liubingyangii]
MGWIISGSVIGVLLLLLILFVIVSYNNFVKTRELRNNAKSQIAVQMETRWDALTSLIQATKQYADYESKVLTDVVEARASVGRNSGVQELQKDENIFTGALSKIMAVAENYPQLKASGVYQQTMTQVAEYEENIRMARMVFNDTTTKFNRMVVVFPTSIVASMFGFKSEEYFQVSEGKAAAPGWN